MSGVVDLESIRDCLRAGLPSAVVTCSPDGVPHISHISQVQYLDRERVATSRQSFNRLAHLHASPFSQALVTRPATGEEFRLDLRYLHTATEGEEFEVTANLARARAMAAADAGDVPGARSAAAVPLVVGKDVLGVLYLESAQPSAFGGPTEGLLRIIGAHAAAALAARGTPARAPVRSPAPGTEPAIELVYYQADDTVLCNSAYLVKGAPGRILWSMLKAHAESGRTQFTNRELRLDESLELPAGNDNLESRLLVLRRRLADVDCGVTLERVGRGRLEIRVERPAELTEVPTRLMQRAAQLRVVETR